MTQPPTATNLIDDALPPKNGATLRDWEDTASLKHNVFDHAKDTFAAQFPQTHGGVRLEVHDLGYEGPEDYSLAEQKDALMSNKYLHRKLVGTYRLFDDKTGHMLDEQRMTVMKVPYLTERGTWIHGGSEYSTINQSRLLPGIYTRRKSNSETESHFNARRGTGPSFRIQLEPQTGVFRMNIGQANLKLYSLLHDIGVPDEHLQSAWGTELLKANKDAYDRRVFDKAYQRLVRRPDPNATREDKVNLIKAALAATKVDKAVAMKTLPNLFNHKIASSWRKSASMASGAAMPPSALPQAPAEAERGVSKDDLLAIAMLLNKQFEAGIPLDETNAALADDIRQAIHADLPGLNPELAAQMQSETQKAAYDKYKIDRAAHGSALSERSPQSYPTKAQIAAGNYAKGHVYLHGFRISIENPKGSYRKGVGPDGKPWKILMRSHYGYVRGATGSDGDQVDVFIGPDVNSKKVFIVNQCKANGQFDEHKVLFGFDSYAAADKGYHANYAPGWKGMDSMVECSMDEFKKKIHLCQKGKRIKVTPALLV